MKLRHLSYLFASIVLLATPAWAQQGTLFVEGDNVGIGTATPSETLHLKDTDGATAARFLIEDTGTGVANKTGFRLRSANVSGGGDWGFEVNSAGNFVIDFLPSVNAEMSFTANPGHNSTVHIFGNLVLDGTCTSCDAVLSPDATVESIEDHATRMWQEGHLPAVGPTADGKTSMDVFAKMAGMLQEIEKAHIYIEQLHRQLEEQSAEIQKLRSAVEAK